MIVCGRLSATAKGFVTHLGAWLSISFSGTKRPKRGIRLVDEVILLLRSYSHNMYKKLEWDYDITISLYNHQLVHVTIRSCGVL
jgi:hypothetical protein